MAETCVKTLLRQPFSMIKAMCSVNAVRVCWILSITTKLYSAIVTIGTIIGFACMRRENFVAVARYGIMVLYRIDGSCTPSGVRGLVGMPCLHTIFSHARGVRAQFQRMKHALCPQT